MYLGVFCLFLVPGLLIVLAWMRLGAAKADSRVPRWRFYCLIACLVAGSCTIPIGWAGSVAWLSVGGDPHGMGTPPGIWMPLNRIFFWGVVTSALLGLCAKGSGRILAIAAAISALLASMAVIILDFE